MIYRKKWWFLEKSGDFSRFPWFWERPEGPLGNVVLEVVLGSGKPPVFPRLIESFLLEIWAPNRAPNRRSNRPQIDLRTTFRQEIPLSVTFGDFWASLEWGLENSDLVVISMRFWGGFWGPEVIFWSYRKWDSDLRIEFQIDFWLCLSWLLCSQSQYVDDVNIIGSLRFIFCTKVDLLWFLCPV